MSREYRKFKEHPEETYHLKNAPFITNQYGGVEIDGTSEYWAPYFEDDSRLETEEGIVYADKDDIIDNICDVVQYFVPDGFEMFTVTGDVHLVYDLEYYGWTDEWGDDLSIDDWSIKSSLNLNKCSVSDFRCFPN